MWEKVIGRTAGLGWREQKKCGSLENGSLENGSLESGSLESGSLENGSLEPPKRCAKKISCGRRLLVEPQGCGGENKKMWIIRECIIRPQKRYVKKISCGEGW